jgi:DNA-binding NarL/FixJ family response regulator
MTAASPTRFALVEDEPEHSRQLQRVLGPAAGFECVIACSSAEEALRTLPDQHLDIILMDIHLGGMSGLECIWNLKATEAIAPIVICTALESEDLILESIAAGASGYVLKHDPPDLIQAVIRDVARGCFAMTRPVARDLQHFFQSLDPQADEALLLSPRECQVLKEIAQGYMDAEILRHLNIELPTLRTYIKHLFDKLHVGTRTEAAARYWQSRQGRFHRLSALVEKLHGNTRRGRNASPVS